MPSIIVVGSGIAGLVTALLAAPRHDVTVVTKADLSESNTRYAQGGIAAATGVDDSGELHAIDTITAGAGLTDPDAAYALAEDGPAIIRLLLEHGVAFDRDGDELARGLEAAHSRARILHAGGDATGAEIERALVAALRSSSARVLENTFALDLVVEDGVVGGITVLTDDGGVRELTADIVVLATGGAGQLFSHTSNPEVATADGLAMALRAGAATADLEFYQFHPTTLALPGDFLVSEAVRGEGAVLRDSSGARFMLDVHPDAELAPRDVVARAIARVMARQGGAPVHLDARSIDPAVIARRFPTISAVCRDNGLDLAHDLIPVTPAAHYWMGGVVTDLDGRTNIRRLYAAGEVARTGVHGANRLASNSLLEGAVFARRVVASIDAGDAGDSGDAGATLWPLHEASAGRRAAPGHITPSSFDRSGLQRLMWDAAGLERTGAALNTAAAVLRGWAVSGAADPIVPLTRRTAENANLLVAARALVDAALARTSSTGAHHRSDDPAQPPAPRAAAASSAPSPDASPHASPTTAASGLLVTNGAPC